VCLLNLIKHAHTSVGMAPNLNSMADTAVAQLQSFSQHEGLSRMNSRERVLATFAHQEPDRAPCWCGSSDEFWAKATQALDLDDEGLRERFRDDFRRVFATYNGPEIALSNGAASRTVFGIERKGLGYGQAVNHPLADAALKEIHGYAWPDPDWMDVREIKSEAESYQGAYAILGGDWSPFWHDVIDLLGMENLLVKMYQEPEIVDAVLQHVVDYYTAVSQNIIEAADGAIDIFFIGNDFGAKILFNGGIDSHHVLLEGTPDTVRQNTKEVLEIMKPGGGYVAGASHDTILGETPLENVLAMFDAIHEYGVY